MIAHPNSCIAAAILALFPIGSFAAPNFEPEPRLEKNGYCRPSVVTTTITTTLYQHSPARTWSDSPARGVSAVSFGAHASGKSGHNYNYNYDAPAGGSAEVDYGRSKNTVMPVFSRVNNYDVHTGTTTRTYWSTSTCTPGQTVVNNGHTSVLTTTSLSKVCLTSTLTYATAIPSAPTNANHGGKEYTTVSTSTYWSTSTCTPGQTITKDGHISVLPTTSLSKVCLTSTLTFTKTSTPYVHSSSQMSTSSISKSEVSPSPSSSSTSKASSSQSSVPESSSSSLSSALTSSSSSVVSSSSSIESPSSTSSVESTSSITSSDIESTTSSLISSSSSDIPSESPTITSTISSDPSTTSSAEPTTSSAPPTCVNDGLSCGASDTCCTSGSTCNGGTCGPPAPVCTPANGPCDLARPDLCCNFICFNDPVQPYCG